MNECEIKYILYTNQQIVNASSYGDSFKTTYLTSHAVNRHIIALIYNNYILYWVDDNMSIDEFNDQLINKKDIISKKMQYVDLLTDELWNMVK